MPPRHVTGSATPTERAARNRLAVRADDANPVWGWSHVFVAPMDERLHAIPNALTPPVRGPVLDLEDRSDCPHFHVSQVYSRDSIDLDAGAGPVAAPKMSITQTFIHV